MTEDPRNTAPREPRGFSSARRKAATLAGDASRIADLVERATRKARGHSGALARVWDDLSSLLRLLKCWATRRYTDVSPRTLVAVIAAVIYFVNPFDLIPDVLPVVGYVDDASVIAFVIASMKSEIERFRAWEGQQDDPPSPAP